MAAAATKHLKQHLTPHFTSALLSRAAAVSTLFVSEVGMELSSMKDLDTVPGDSFFHDFNVLLRDILKEHSAEQSRLLEAAFERHQQFASAKFHALERLCSALAMPTLQEVGQLHSCPDEPCQVGISDCDLEQQSVSGSVDGGVLVQSPTSTEHDNRTSIPRSQSTKLGASNYCQNYSSDMPSVVTEKVHAMAERYSGLAVRRLKCDPLLKFVTGDWFTSVIALLIVINSVVICVNTDYELRVAVKKYNDSGTSDQTVSDFFWMTDLCFTFFTVPDHQWNLLDTVIVVISLMETVFRGCRLGIELHPGAPPLQDFSHVACGAYRALLREAPHHDQRSGQLHLILDLGLDAHCVHHGHVQRRPPPGRDDLHLG